MNVLILGSGAREHALAWKLRQSARVTDLHTAPGNAGTEEISQNIELALTDHEAIVRECRALRIDLAVVGSEEPLASGLIDRLAVEGIAAFGPTRAAAEIEWSKAFAKRLMANHAIPTAAFRVFESSEAARSFIEGHAGHLVVKADGLALGKGVVVANNQDEAIAAVDAAIQEGAFGASGSRVVIEERLTGPEVSAQAFTDGKTVRHMPFSCDHKPVFDGDHGPNTGGMGAYSPAEWLDEDTGAAIRTDITEAALAAMHNEGRVYRGVLYPGVMVTDAGPMVIEFNARLGDPETQALLPRMESDLLDILWATANSRLHEVDISWSKQASVSVVLASGGYPLAYEKGLPITGLDDLDDDVLVFHAGTARNGEGNLVTAGGRVLTITALGATVEEAQIVAYRNVERVKFKGVHFRSDIGANAMPPARMGTEKR